MKIIDINQYRKHKPEVKLNSAFYIGRVFHRRNSPKVHEFTYPLYMMYLDLDETERLHGRYWWFSTHRWAPLQFNERDYFRTITGNNSSTSAHSGEALKQKAINIAKSLGANTGHINRVFMLAQMRCFGLYFSPVNFFFLYSGTNARYLLAEVSNTPWNEKHCYLINLDAPLDTPKTFHVSPFMTLEMVYRWTVKAPMARTFIRIENWNKHKLFTAQFSAVRCEITEKNVSKVLLTWPAITFSIIRGIYFQALKLFLKRIPYVPYQNVNSENKPDEAELTEVRSVHTEATCKPEFSKKVPIKGASNDLGEY